MIQDLNEALETCETLVVQHKEQQQNATEAASAASGLDRFKPIATPSQHSWTEACQTVGNILTSMGFITEAYRWRSMALDLSPNSSRFYAESGRVYSQCEVWDKAAYYCQRTLAENPGSLKVRHHLAKVYNKLGDYRAESQVVSDLLAMAPRIATAKGHLDLGWIMQNQGQKQEAENCFKRAIKRDDKFADAYYALGDLYLQQGNTDAAITLFQRLVEQLSSPEESSEEVDRASAGKSAAESVEVPMDDESTVAEPVKTRAQERAMAYYRLGKAHRQAQQFELAVTNFRSALEIDNRLHWAYMGLMNVLMELQKWDEVAATSDSIVKSVEPFPWAYGFKGNALARKGDSQQAAIAHQQAFALRGWPQCAERGYEFNLTWFGESIPIWESLFAQFNEPGVLRSPMQILSLGSSDSSSLCWLVDQVLKQSEDKLVCITPDVSANFQNNVDRLPKNEQGANKVDFQIGNLHHQLAALSSASTVQPAEYEADLEESKENLGSLETEAGFEIIYLQSGNKEGDFVKSLAALAWPLLKPNGLMVFKDYQWRHPTDAAKSAQVGIDAFIDSVANSIEVVHQSHQLVIKKAPPFQENP